MSLFCVPSTWLPHTKDSQVLGSAERNTGTNHELIPKYQFRPLGHVGMWILIGGLSLIHFLLIVIEQKVISYNVPIDWYRTEGYT